MPLSSLLPKATTLVKSKKQDNIVKILIQSSLLGCADGVLLVHKTMAEPSPKLRVFTIPQPQGFCSFQTLAPRILYQMFSTL